LIKESIQTGGLKPGDRIEPEDALSRKDDHEFDRDRPSSNAPATTVMVTSVAASAGEAVAAVTDAFAGAYLEPESVLRVALERLSHLRSGTWIATLMGEDPRTQLVVAANGEEPQVARYVEERNPVGAAPTWSFSQTVIETGQPVLVPQVSYDEFLAMQVPEEAEKLRADKPPTEPIASVGFVMVALRTLEATTGTLALFDHRCPEPLNADDVRWVQALADRIAIGVENGQMRVAARDRLNRLAALRSVVMAMAGGPDLRLHLQVILDQAIAGLGVKAADVLVLDEADGTLRIAAVAGFRTSSVPEYRLSIHEVLPGQPVAGQAGAPEIELDEGRRRTLFAREGFKSRRAVPLISQGTMNGVLEVFARGDGQPDQEWLDFLEMLACEAAVAIDRARMRSRFESNAPGNGIKALTSAPDFSRLDVQILGLVAQGLSNAAIAHTVHLSQHTIKFHVHRMLRQAGVTNRTELARKATDEGWL
jgi:DNA-binding CsgD family transcriptional regulator/GAF domain-containing protein